MLYYYRDKAKYWSQMTQFFSYALHSAKSLRIIFSGFDTIPTCDRPTDKQTDIWRRHSLRYAQHRAVNILESKKDEKYLK